MNHLLYFPFLVSILFLNSTRNPETKTLSSPDPQLYTILLTSTSFMDHGLINTNNTCEGANTSPDLAWDSVPANTKAFAIVCQDIDVNPNFFVHWMIYNIPGDQRSLDDNITTIPDIGNGVLQGLNDFNKIGYSGPCPPDGFHRYIFIIYALDDMLPIDGGAPKYDVLNAIDKHVIGMGKLTGKYRNLATR
jgi:Raf kinase inhibitor-like YbhB/YbcL family protein